MFCEFFSIVCRYYMYQVFIGCNGSMVFNANGTASFPESLRIQTLEVSLSLMVTSAPLWLLPITVSISKSQNTKNRCPVLGRRLMIYENDYMVFTYFSFQFTYASSFLRTGILALGPSIGNAGRGIGKDIERTSALTTGLPFSMDSASTSTLQPCVCSSPSASFR